MGLGGPRGSFVIPVAFDWHVLIGDDTAIPAVARRLEELPPGKKALVLLEVDDASCEVPLNSSADVNVRWLHRKSGAASESDSLLPKAAAELVLPEGEGYVWAAAESRAARAIRETMISVHGIAKDRIRASSYWKRGAVAVHETHEG